MAAVLEWARSEAAPAAISEHVRVLGSQVHLLRKLADDLERRVDLSACGQLDFYELRRR